MSELNKPDLSWPPEGFQELGDIKNLSAQAISKDPHTAKVIGASYTIEISALQRDDKKDYIYSFQIDAWEYTINNESREFPILSFVLKPDAGYRGIGNIKTYSCPVKTTRKSSQRTYMAALSMLRSISDGIVPDLEQYLKIYKIHPSQKKLYERERDVAKRFFELFDKTKRERSSL